MYAYKDPPKLKQLSVKKSSDDRSQNKCATNHKIAKLVTVYMAFIV